MFSFWRRLCEAFGGASSRPAGPGSGSEFVVTLPTCRVS